MAARLDGQEVFRSLPVAEKFFHFVFLVVCLLQCISVLTANK